MVELTLLALISPSEIIPLDDVIPDILPFTFIIEPVIPVGVFIFPKSTLLPPALTCCRELPLIVTVSLENLTSVPESPVCWSTPSTSKYWNEPVPNVFRLPVNRCVSSIESPNAVEPDFVAITTLVTDDVTLY